MNSRPYSNLQCAELSHLAKSPMETSDFHQLSAIRRELDHRKSRQAEKLKRLVTEAIEASMPSSEGADGPTATKTRRKEPGKNTIAALTRLAEAAMRDERDEELKALESMLELRPGPAARHLCNRIGVYLWDKGLKPSW